MFCNLCALVIPPRSDMRLGLSSMAFIMMKLEQILAGTMTDLSDQDARSALKTQKEELVIMLEESESFSLDPKNPLYILSLAVDKQDEPDAKAGSAATGADCD